jgi:hypothetical protein
LFGNDRAVINLTAACSASLLTVAGGRNPVFPRTHPRF